MSTVALATGIGFSLVYFVFHAWSPWAPGPTYLLHDTFIGFGPFVNPGVLLCLAWAAGVALALAGRHRAMRVAMAVVIALAVVLFVIDRPAHGAWYGPSGVTLVFFAALAVAAIVGTPRLRSRLAIGSGIAIVLWGLDYVRVGAHFHTLGTAYADERNYVNIAVTPFVLATFLVLPIAAVVFAIARRPGVASILMLSFLPWLVMLVANALSLGGAVGFDGWLWELGQLATPCLVWLIAYAIVQRIGRYRLRSRQPEA